MTNTTLERAWLRGLASAGVKAIRQFDDERIRQTHVVVRLDLDGEPDVEVDYDHPLLVRLRDAARYYWRHQGEMSTTGKVFDFTEDAFALGRALAEEIVTPYLSVDDGIQNEVRR